MMENNGVEILLVEDNPVDVDLTLDALAQAKLANHVYVVHDGAEALEFIFCTGQYADRVNQNPKLILLDINLPKLNGIEVLKRIRADPKTRQIPIAILTTSSEERDVFESYATGVNSYIVKPVDFEQFTEVVRALGFYWFLVNHPPAQAPKTS